jgi:hypothetical protein
MYLLHLRESALAELDLSMRQQAPGQQLFFALHVRHGCNLMDASPKQDPLTIVVHAKRDRLAHERP